jgi:putative DNA primase/helicase
MTDNSASPKNQNGPRRDPLRSEECARSFFRRHGGQANERSVAEMFAVPFNWCWRYNVDEHMWLEWLDSHWGRNRTLEFCEKLGHWTSKFANRLLGPISLATATKLQQQRTVAAIEKICRGLPVFLARNCLFDADPFLLGTPSGTVDLRTGEMRAADPADHITVLTTVAPAPPGTPCPRWQAFLDEVTANDKDLQRTLQQWFGISASGTSRDQKILFLYGPGGNGKGVLLRTIAGLLGEHAVNAPRDLLMVQKNAQHPTALVDVVKARMVMATEIPEDAVWDVALVKDLTGGDLVPVRRMRQDFYRATARCSITISGNRKPTLRDIDEAVRRRFLVATFGLKVEKVIVDLEKQFIREEGPAILRWIIDGAVDRERSGRLHVAEVITADTEDYFAEENLLRDFIDTYLQPAPDEKVRTAEVYSRWRDYCTRSGRTPGARNTFTTAMQAAGVAYRRANDGRYFIDVRLGSGGYNLG